MSACLVLSWIDRPAAFVPNDLFQTSVCVCICMGWNLSLHNFNLERDDSRIGVAQQAV